MNEINLTTFNPPAIDVMIQRFGSDHDYDYDYEIYVVRKSRARSCSASNVPLAVKQTTRNEVSINYISCSS